MSGAEVVKVTFNVPAHFAKLIQDDADRNMVDRGTWVRVILGAWYEAKGDTFVTIGELSETMKKSDGNK